MIIWGLRPGPLLFQEHPDFVWGLISSLYIANFVALVINLACIPLFVRVLTLRFTILAPIIFVLCIVGGYAPEQSMHDVWLMLIFGVTGYLMRKLNYPVAPAVLAIVLGPLAERSLRQSLLISQGEASIFFTRPISAACIAIAVALILYPLLLSWRRRGAREPGGRGRLTVAAWRPPRRALQRSSGHGIRGSDRGSPPPSCLWPRLSAPANVLTTIEEAHERSAFTGLDPEDLVAFRPERLVVHELLIRVMGDVSVPDGPDYADLGVNFRKITETIHRSLHRSAHGRDRARLA